MYKPRDGVLQVQIALTAPVEGIVGPAYICGSLAIGRKLPRHSRRINDSGA